MCLYVYFCLHLLSVNNGCDDDGGGGNGCTCWYHLYHSLLACFSAQDPQSIMLVKFSSTCSCFPFVVAAVLYFPGGQYLAECPYSLVWNNELSPLFSILFLTWLNSRWQTAASITCIFFFFFNQTSIHAMDKNNTE